MISNQHTVLYVDDEPANLTAFAYCFEEEMRVLVAGSGAEALEILQKEPVALLLADQRMPGMSGSELCAVVRERHPDVVRMIVTAYADVADAVAAINNGQVARYILKPWREETMRDILRAGVEAYQLGALVHDLQVRLVTSEQQATTTFLLARVLHELNNPAASISNNVRWMHDAMGRLRALAPTAPEFTTLFAGFQEALDDTVEGCRELAARLERFREGHPPETRGVVPVDMTRVVDAAVAIVRSLARARARLMVEHASVPCLVTVDRMHLSQVLVNLLTNAAEAIEPGRAEQNRIAVRTWVDETHAYVAIEDTGRGIAPESLAQVFEPYYTSKHSSGHGVGLSLVRDLVQNAGGAVSVTSEVGRGTTFTVAFPLPT